MKTWALSALIAAAVAGIVGFAVGRRTAGRIPETSPPPASAPTYAGAASRTEEESGKRRKIDTSEIDSLPESSPPSSPGKSVVTGKDRLMAMILPFLSEKQKQEAMLRVFQASGELQGRLFDLLMATDDRELLEAGQDLLITRGDNELVKRMAAAFASETNPDRKAMLAQALAGSADLEESNPVIAEVLFGRDTRLQERVLARLTLEFVEEDFKARVAPHLRDLVVHGATATMRVGAARALRGDLSETGIRFLIDRMLNDPDLAVQQEAQMALPAGWATSSPLQGEQAAGFWAVFNDTRRPARVRRWAAQGIHLVDSEHVPKEWLTATQGVLRKKD